MRKTSAANAAIAAGCLRDTGIEGLLRDVYAAQFRPLPERKRQEFTGRLGLGLDPVA